jgi:hypothetical protein
MAGGRGKIPALFKRLSVDPGSFRETKVFWVFSSEMSAFSRVSQ